MSQMEQAISDLQEENRKLREFAVARIGQKKTEELVKEGASSANFITNIQEISNRTLDSKALSVLEELRKEVPDNDRPITMVG